MNSLLFVDATEKQETLKPSKKEPFLDQEIAQNLLMRKVQGMENVLNLELATTMEIILTTSQQKMLKHASQDASSTRGVHTSHFTQAIASVT